MHIILLKKACALFALLQLVSSENFAFLDAEITVKNLGEKLKRTQRYKNLKTIDQHLFGNAVKLKVVTANVRLYPGSVKNLPHLKSLRMKECGISYIAPGAFKNLQKLEAIFLHENDLTVIENDVFNFLPIRKLWLQRNEIRAIRSGAFDNMPNLEEIRLNKNELTKWDSRWFANTPKLTHIYFTRNEINDLPPRAFVNIKPSHKINGSELVDTRILLGGNQISFIHPETFDGIDALYELDLRINKLEALDKRTFSPLGELHILNLKRNNISEIDKNFFENLSEMDKLDLSKNHLECVPYEVIRNVKVVNVTGNADLDCDCFNNLREKLSEDKRGTRLIKDDEDCNSNIRIIN